MAGVSFSTPGPVSVMAKGITGTFQWAGDTASLFGGRFNQAQMFVDSEVLRYCDPMTPKVTGMLIASGKLGTVIGSGMVRYTIVYAAPQYYKFGETRPYDANRGGKWFERMKPKHKQDILEGAQRIIGGG